jgi:hypothetical protein
VLNYSLRRTKWEIGIGVQSNSDQFVNNLVNDRAPSKTKGLL